jgi:hypothetical protein
MDLVKAVANEPKPGVVGQIEFTPDSLSRWGLDSGSKPMFPYRHEVSMCNAGESHP